MMAAITNALREDLFPGNASALSDLERFMREGGVTAFSGAGVSVPLFPAWSGLLNELLEQAINGGLETEQDTIREWKRQVQDDPLELASALEQTFNRDVFRSKFARVFENPDGRCTAAHETIAKLRLRGIVTLNYDDGHEVAYANAFSGKANSGRAQDKGTLTNWMQNDIFGRANPPILHLHGDVSDPSQMILTADDYDRHYKEHLVEQVVQHIWRSHRLLVVGFGFTDPFLTRLAQITLRNLPTDNRHFALIGRPEGESVSPYVRQQFSKKFRLIPIFYEVKHLAGASRPTDHSALLDLLNALPGVDPSKLVKVSSDGSTATVIALPPGGKGKSVVLAASSEQARIDFERDLFLSPRDKLLYVEPVFTDHFEGSEGPLGVPASQFSIADVVTGTDSFVISCRPEFGASTLGRRLMVEFAKLGKRAILKDATALPNYKRKLNEELEPAQLSREQQPILILDDFDFVQHERLLKEVIGLDLFSRIILLARVNLFSAGNALPIDQFKLPFRLIAVSGLSPSDIRDLTTQFFDTSDTDFVSSTVHKIYEDLLALCIPLTPSNVIMYLTILHKDGDFTAINRVQIVARYLNERLRKPSDAFSASFTSRNKMDIVGSFVFQLFKAEKWIWTEADWFLFCRQHMEDTLTNFDERVLLNDLIAARIFVRLGTTIVFNYRFFYIFFLGYHVSNRASVLSDFLADSSYLNHAGLTEVISELSSDNQALVSDIVSKLDAAFGEFADQYVAENFDPFSQLDWPTDPKEQENLWDPLTNMLAEGPKNPEEIDQIKRSRVAEKKTSNQQVLVQKFDQLERRLVRLHWSLIEALRNSDSLPAELKKAAVVAALRGFFRLYQVGLIFAHELADAPFFIWGGFLFVNRMNFSPDKTPHRKALDVASAIHAAFIRKAAEDLGSRKLGEVFKALARESDGYLGSMNFSCLLRAKPKDWSGAAAAAVASVDRKALQLRTMLYIAFEQFNEQVNTAGEREEQKRIIATIQIKRRWNRDHPGTKHVSEIVEKLEKLGDFAPESPRIGLEGEVDSSPDSAVSSDSSVKANAIKTIISGESESNSRS